jgi:DnaJ-like protein
MDTLYDLLGALPRDDAESLRSAFRRAVKGAHPDIRPDDPDAALRFRQIVRANEILADPEQRAAYDHLLVLARIEKDPAAAHPIAAKIHKMASGVLALAAASIVTAGGYLLFTHLSLALIVPVESLAAASNLSAVTDLTTRLSASIAAVSPADAPDPAAVNAFIARAEVTSAGATTAADTVPAADTESNLSFSMALPDPAPGYANFLHTQEVSAHGEVNGAGADPEPVAQLDTKFTASYADRGILFFREKKGERDFPDLSPVKRAEKPARPKSLLAAAAKNHPDALPKVVPLPQPRTAPRVSSRPPSYAAAGFQ